MAKRIEKDGKFYRLRRGVLVEIPAEWVGNVTTKQAIRKRNSKLTNKLARYVKWRRDRVGDTGPMYVDYMDSKLHGDDIQQRLSA